MEQEKYVPRLLKEYREKIVGQLREQFGYSNDLATPRLLKIVINMGVGVAITDHKLVEIASKELGQLSGQKAKICRARKPISNFKLRENVPIGCCVTLRRSRMYEFFDRLISVAIPRIRDFRGITDTAFDGRGNYNFGLTEQGIFPEINPDKITRTQGMNISVHTSAVTDNEARELLKLFGFPFRKANEDN